MSYYYKLRYTFPSFPDDDELVRMRPRPKMEDTFAELVELIREYTATKMIATIETLDKHGQECKTHCHIHFDSNSEKKAIAVQLNRKIWNKLKYVKISGRVYYLKAQPERSNRHWTYPLKTKPLNEWTSTSLVFFGFEQRELEDLSLVGHEEWKVGCVVHENKQAKKEDTSWADRFTSYLDDFPGLKTHKSIFLQLYEFYKLNDKPLNYKNILGNAYLYMAKKNLINGEEFYNLHQ